MPPLSATAWRAMQDVGRGIASLADTMPKIHGVSETDPPNSQHELHDAGDELREAIRHGEEVFEGKHTGRRRKSFTRWIEGGATTPSGRAMFVCRNCLRITDAPTATCPPLGENAGRVAAKSCEEFENG